MKLPADHTQPIQRMIWANLFARPIRTSISVLAIALQVFLVLFMVGLTTGIVSEWGKRVEGIGADIMVQPPNSSIFFAFTSAVMSEKVGDQIRQIDGVLSVAPVLVLVNSEKTLNLVYGIDYESFNGLSHGFLFHSGGRFTGPNDVLIDDIKARASHLRVGDTLSLLNREFRICGVVEHGKGARYFIPIETAREMTGAEGRVSVFFLRSAAGATAEVKQALIRLLPRHTVRGMQEYVSLMSSSNLPELRPFIRSMVTLGVVVSFLVVLLTMYTVILERSREIGILKALGASRLDIVELFLRETLLMALLGIVAGLVSTFVVRAIVLAAMPTLTIIITQGWIARAVGLAILGALAGSLYPAFRAAQFDPVEVLAYE